MVASVQSLSASPDLLVLGFLVLLVFLYSVTFPATRAAQTLFSLYAARAGLAMSGEIFERMFTGFSPSGAFFGMTVVFFLGFALIFWAIGALFGSGVRKKMSWLGASVFHTAILGLFLATLFSFWEPKAFQISELMRQIFVSGRAQFLWFWLPLGLLVFLRFKNKLL